MHVGLGRCDASHKHKRVGAGDQRRAGILQSANNEHTHTTAMLTTADAHTRCCFLACSVALYWTASTFMKFDLSVAHTSPESPLGVSAFPHPFCAGLRLLTPVLTSLRVVCVLCAGGALAGL